ncbi:hypothetical protein NHX12_026122 [Muraenolepis orangiensis]|uniref:Uncharacterized protein n=1 Tax=Muraenolepis orangiensis TaxID=630683 RepID=A0A9Q0EJ21_9TELE|nr:hypothetical protein NHX12_026122 [Muraenolepis orangiensis]
MLSKEPGKVKLNRRSLPAAMRRSDLRGVLCSDASLEEPQLQSDLDQEYQDKFRRLPLEIQEFVQDKRQPRPRDDLSLHSGLSVSSTGETLSRAPPSEDETDDGSAERSCTREDENRPPGGGRSGRGVTGERVFGLIRQVDPLLVEVGTAPIV